MRKGPSIKFTMIKRSFFTKIGDPRRPIRHPIDDVVEALKGVYSSIRLCRRMGEKETGLAVNVDVANGTFWASQVMTQVARNLTKAVNRDSKH
jgi:eukaryotic translation initiation factor 2C